MQRPESPAAVEDNSRRDKNYRRYASNVERALSLFDTALQEWADYIAFLGRLLKALQSKPSDTAEVPHKSIVAKRLAQCLAPSLPSGVHQKTLEVYAYVFSVLGKDGLSRDLPLWLPGLSPTLSFASLSIKPTLLSLFETFIVSLNPKILRSALKAIILALLPGLEEETSEEFERTLSLLNKFRAALSQGAVRSTTAADVTGDQYFWQSLFLASITSSSRRQGSLAYLTRELPPMGYASTVCSNPQASQDVRGVQTAQGLPSAVEAVTSPEPGLLIRCFAAGLQDEQLLIQRGFLDLLVSHLPLHASVCHQRVAPKDLELLIVSAASVVARRDMSLNRRLWSWFLGPESSADREDSAPSSPSLPVSGDPINHGEIQNLSQIEYFERYGLDPLVNGILEMFDNKILLPSKKARPFRICLSLMDRWEIGGLVIQRVFIPAMESIWQYEKTAESKDAFAEVLRSANVFFDGIESSLIWAELTGILIRALRLNQTAHHAADETDMNSETLLQLVSFVTAKFNIREEEMLKLHIPLATLAVLISLRLCLEQDQALLKVNPAQLVQAFKIATQLLDATAPRVLQAPKPVQETRVLKDSRKTLEDIQLFYQKLQKGSEDVAPPISMGLVGETMLGNISQAIIISLSTVPIQMEFLERANNFLEKLLRKTTTLDENTYDSLIWSISEASEKLAIDEGAPLFQTIAALVSLLETVKISSPSNMWESDHRIRKLLPRLLADLWEYTSPSKPKHNVEAVRHLWRIHWISPDYQLVEGSISTLLLRKGGNSSGKNLEIESARRFVTVWAHSSSSKYSSSKSRSSMGRNSITPELGITSKSSDSRILDRPLFLLLDSLFDDGSELSLFVSGWLQSLSSIQMWAPKQRNLGTLS